MNEHSDMSENLISNQIETHNFDPELLEIFDGYQQGHITKREFLECAERFAVGGLTADILFSMLSPSITK